MMCRSTPMQAAAFTVLLATGAAQWASAQTEPFSVELQVNAEDRDPDTACAIAYDDAAGQAQERIDAYYRATEADQSYRAILVRQTQTRSLTAQGSALCEVDSYWQALNRDVDTLNANESDASASASEADRTIDSNGPLIGSEQYIDGVYTSTCENTRNGDLCWQRIVKQAQADLFDSLTGKGIDLALNALQYLDFAGRQRDEQNRRQLDMTADGRFFFRVVDVDLTPTPSSAIRIDRKNSPMVPRTSPSSSTAKMAIAKKTGSASDLTLRVFYSADGNDLAQTDHLAISANRWGLGLWNQDQIGFAIFSGYDRLGLGDNANRVKTVAGGYETFGVGMGFRLWPGRALSVENMLYYVDAQPYRALIDPGCTSCTARLYQSDDYVQATVNIKTNSDGLNIGWIFTWKLLQPGSDIDSLSSGLYLELQF
ncbi:hypothetical protein [Reinekea sp.]|uniref:hypothetical protein n=1 Tax=Reinekea sp. TaxID=1970455 RepID=UPI00257BCEFA|nr:hypothetical protein [Reinekea sp.]MDO7640555.1 hypothetical protein [Reinekea forsetii]